MVYIDELYDKVNSGNLSTDELESIVTEVDTGNSFNNSSFTSTDLYIKIARDPNCTDELIEKMVMSQFDNYRGDEGLYNLLNLGTKATFDKIWKFAIGTGGGKILSMYKSKFADEDQIEYIWTTVVKKKSTADKRWLQTLHNSILRHKNCPEKIINRQLRNKESLLNIAINPGIKEKAVKVVCDYGKIQRHDGIFENFLRNKGLGWKEIADAMDIKYQMKVFAEETYENMSTRRKAAIYEFFRRKDTPEKAKMVMFKLTGENEFAPQEIQDVFFF